MEDNYYKKGFIDGVKTFQQYIEVSLNEFLKANKSLAKDIEIISDTLEKEDFEEFIANIPYIVKELNKE
jgi:hypothetical protein